MTAATPADDDRLRPLWRVVHERLSAGGPAARVRVGDWDDVTREAVADLLGLDRLPVPGRQLTLAALDQAVGGQGDTGRLRWVVEAALGPVGDRRAGRAADRQQRAALWTWLEGHPSVRAEPALRDWAAHVRRAGLVSGSVPRTRELLDRALAVLAALPAEGVGLPVLADRILHDPHALDDGRRVTGVVLQALASLTGIDADGGAEARRALWQRLGVETDALSSTVLVAGLRGVGPGYLRVLLDACAGAGEAAVLTLAQVRGLSVGPDGQAWSRPSRSSGPAGSSGQGVHVVENPSVLAAALARFGSGCPPLVCTSGWPSAAGVLLLRRLRDAGAPLHYHGDLDGDGLRIATHLVARVGAVPWRMDTDRYRAALARRPGGPPAGRVSDVPWDRALAPAMRAAGVAVTEESVVDDLLDDLLEDLTPPGTAPPGHP